MSEDDWGVPSPPKRKVFSFQYRICFLIVNDFRATMFGFTSHHSHPSQRLPRWNCWAWVPPQLATQWNQVKYVSLGILHHPHTQTHICNIYNVYLSHNIYIYIIYLPVILYELHSSQLNMCPWRIASVMSWLKTLYAIMYHGKCNEVLVGRRQRRWALPKIGTCFQK